MEPSETCARIQSVRIKNLEEQIYLMRRELQGIHERILQQNDVVKLNNLLDRLKELSSILIDLRNYYNFSQRQKSTQRRNNARTQRWYTVQQNVTSDENDHFERCSQKYKSLQRENAGFDERNSQPEPSRVSQSNKRQTETSDNNEEANGAAAFKTCKQLMDETKTPSSILGNYLVRLQDFRTDPELRRKRLERKQQEKLQELYKRRSMSRQSEDRGTLTEDIDQKIKRNYIVENSNCLAVPTDNEVCNKSSIRAIETNSNLSFGSLRVIKSNLFQVVEDVIYKFDKKAIALTVVLERDLIYHISVSLISNGHLLSCFLATDEAMEEAKRQYLFQDILTLFVVHAENSKMQKDRLLGHWFEFF